MTRSRNTILAAAFILAAACSTAGRGEFIADGDYSGVDAQGHEIQVAIQGNVVNVNGVKTDVDDTALHLTFDVSDARHAHWVCRPIDQGIRCDVSEKGKHQAIELMET